MRLDRGSEGDFRLDFSALVACGALIFALAMLGGSSRTDAAQIVLLRPLVALLLLFPLLSWQFANSNVLRPMCILLGFFALWVGFQLVPLPPAFWAGSVPREPIMAMDGVLGLGAEWRPISLVPGRTINALFSLIVPAAALIFAVRYFREASIALVLIAIIVSLDALLGMAQVMSGRSSPLYFYSPTSLGYPVGIFANENHSAALSAIGLLIFAKLAFFTDLSRRQPWLNYWFALGAACSLLALMVSGSRAGLALGAFALIAALASFLLRSRRGDVGRSALAERPTILRHPAFIGIFFVLALGVLAAIFLFADRSPAFADIFARDSFANLRWRLGPVLMEMIRDFWTTGSGIGTFEHVYQMYEPTQLLLSKYVNQAHNDWAQTVIEGGIIAAGLLAALLVWISLLLSRLLRSGAQGLAEAVLWTAMLLVLGAASIVDYPLRTPAFQAIGIWVVAGLALASHVSARTCDEQKS